MKEFVIIFFSICSGFCLMGQKKWVVSKNSDGNFSNVQAALDAIPKNNKETVVIFIRKGIYREKLHLDSTKDLVVLEGEDKFNTILTYNDHTGKIAPTGETINTRTSWSFIIKANDFKATNLTFENDAGFTAGQAVAVEVQGDRASFFNCRFIGNQDVLFTNNDNSRQYFADCYIEGTTDFIFGSSTAWFERCHIHSKKNSHVTASASPLKNAFGYVFNECILTSDSSVTRVSLGRPWQPYASVTYIRCYLDRHIISQGWDNWRNPANEKTARYSEFENYGPGANVHQRVPWSKQLTKMEAEQCGVERVLRGWEIGKG
ncbi:MAG TPA: pectinesterase family protein, partial [Cyclobacteriaceae bacterium]|nr:pectinesterase family protein [Cyclobacteriaceae bacterium]